MDRMDETNEPKPGASPQTREMEAFDAACRKCVTGSRGGCLDVLLDIVALAAVIGMPTKLRREIVSDGVRNGLVCEHCRQAARLQPAAMRSHGVRPPVIEEGCEVAFLLNPELGAVPALDAS